MKRIFTVTERSVIRTLYRLNRFANANEISKVSGISWATVKKILNYLYTNKKILNRKTIRGAIHYRIKPGY